MPSTKAEKLITAGVIVAVLSAIAVLAGQKDPSLQGAQELVILGAMGFLAGLALFIVGMTQR